MHFKPIVLIFLLFISYATLPSLLQAQTPSSDTRLPVYEVLLSDAKMRIPIDLSAERGIIRLCGLVPGNTYTSIAIGRMAGQEIDFNLQLLSAGIAQQITYPDAVRFTAESVCADFLVETIGASDEEGIPMYLSVKCETCPEANAWKKNLLNATGAALLQVEGGFSAEELISDVLVDGDCFGVDNVTFNGVPSQIGTFSNGGNNIGFQNGVIIATGGIVVAPGPNDDDNADAGFGFPTFDFDLFNIADEDIFDRAGIEFDFTPTETPVTFQFVFASEEYCEYVFSQFNDVFGFFVSGPGISGTQNVALVPNSADPVSINTINHQVNDDYYNNNQPLFSSNLCGQFPSFDASTLEVQYDGFTTGLTAVVNVIPCSTYHIKLKIADVGDGIFDSAVFLKAGSFDGGGDATVEFSVNGDTDAAEANEGCDDVALVLNRVGNDPSQPVTVSFTVSGTANAGADFTPINSSYVIPAGQDQLTVPIDIIADLVPEGAETIVLTLDNSCSCDVSQKTLSILDYAPIADTSFTFGICNSGDGITLTASPAGGTAPFSYDWNTGQSTESIFVNPDTTSTYTVTIVDACSDTAVNIFLVQVQALAEITENISFCPGGSYTVGDSTYTQTTTLTVSIDGQNGDCDTLLTYNISLLPLSTLSDSIRICFGQSVSIGDSVYSQSTTVTDTLPGSGGACDTIVVYVLEVLPLVATNDTIAFCPGGSVVINGTTYDQPGTVTDTLPGTNGACDTIATYVLQLLPQPAFSDTIALCPGSTIALGDSTYTAPATVSLVLEGQNGACDTLATYVLELKPQVTLDRTLSFCPGESVLIGGTNYTQAGTVTDTLPGVGGACDTIAHYTLVVLPQVSFTDTITFCPGDTLMIGGTAYTTAGTVKDTLPGSSGVCDTLAIYVLVSLTPAPSVVTLDCPGDITVTAEPPLTTYTLPSATSDCPCPGISLQQTSGLASGSIFPVGVTQVCYVAKDSCGNTASCCFEVTVPDEEPCEETTIGCIKYELIDIKEDAQGNNTYRIRVTNNCTTKLMYAAFSLPPGVVALAPPNNSIYTAPSGREYSVRNPNYSPFYSIRFRADIPEISNGQSDLFEFTLPALANPVNIHGIVRVQPKIFYETYLSTSNCPVETISKPEMGGHPAIFAEKTPQNGMLTVFPNPNAGTLHADLSDWKGQTVYLRVLDSQGREVMRMKVEADTTPQEIRMPDAAAGGLYFLEATGIGGEKRATRFVLQRD